MKNEGDEPANDHNARARETVEWARQQAHRATKPHATSASLVNNGGIPGYELTRQIHHGGQGVVFEAIQSSTNRRVAIKVMHTNVRVCEYSAVRFKREVEILSEIKHPNIVALLDGGIVDGRYYLVMDFIDGEQLDAYIDARRLSVVQTLELFADVAAAVNEAHLKGVVHRDLKPSNVVIDDNGEPHILDFGLAKIVASAQDEVAAGATATGHFLGSLPWSSPEQAACEHDRIDVRSDVYALGLMLFAALTGNRPYETQGSLSSILNNVLHAQPTAPSAFADTGVDVDSIVLKCLEKDPQRRYQSAGELDRDIRRFLAGDPIEARRQSTFYVLNRIMAKHRRLTALAIAGLILTFAYAATMTVLYQRTARAEHQAQDKSERALKALSFVASTLSDRLEHVPGAQRARRELLEYVYGELQEFLDERPGDLRYLRAFAQTHVELGRIAQALSNIDGAKLHFDRALVILEALASQSPDDPLLQARLSVSLVHVGDVAFQLADEPTAYSVYGQALAIDEALVGAAPNNVLYLDNLLWSYDRMSAIESKRRNFELAAQIAEKQLSIAEQAYTLDLDAGRSYSMSGALARMGSVFAQQGDFQAASDFSQRATEYALEAYDREPDNVFFLNCAASHLHGAGKSALRAGQFQSGTKMLSKAIQYAEDVVAAEPSVSLYQATLAHAHAVIATAILRDRQFELAESSSRSWLREATRLYTVAPNEYRSHIFLLNAYHSLASALCGLDRQDEARTFAEQGLAFAEKTLKNRQDDAAFLVYYSKFLLYAKPSDLRDPARALQLAKRAVDLTNGEDPEKLVTLATTHWVLGDAVLSIATLRRALELLPQHDHALRPRIERYLRDWGHSDDPSDSQ